MSQDNYEDLQDTDEIEGQNPQSDDQDELEFEDSEVDNSGQPIQDSAEVETAAPPPAVFQFTIAKDALSPDEHKAYIEAISSYDADRIANANIFLAGRMAERTTQAEIAVSSSIKSHIPQPFMDKHGDQVRYYLSHQPPHSRATKEAAEAAIAFAVSMDAQNSGLGIAKAYEAAASLLSGKQTYNNKTTQKSVTQNKTVPTPGVSTSPNGVRRTSARQSVDDKLKALGYK